MTNPKFRARILAFIGADGCTGRALYEEFRGRALRPALTAMLRDGVIEHEGGRYSLGTPTADDAHEHLAAHGALGARIVELAAGRVPLADLLSRRKDAEVSRARGFIVSQLRGATHGEIAAALRIHPKTVAVYRGQVAA